MVRPGYVKSIDNRYCGPITLLWWHGYYGVVGIASVV